MNAPHAAEIYKIASAEVFAEAQRAGRFDGMPIDAQDGFMHFSDGAQLRETLKLHFRGQRDLVLLAVRAADLGQNLRWEPSRGGALFPHLYAPLALTAILWSAPIAVAADGHCDLPAAVK